MRRLLTALALTAGILSPAASLSSALADEPEVDGIGIRIVDVPTATADDPRARSYIIDHLAPGSVIERRVEVTNGTRSPADVSVYPAAASIESGSFVGADGRTRNDLSTWTSVAPHSLDLAPQESAFVRVSVRVPPRAAPGERYGVVWAEVTTPPRTQGGLTQVSRVGVRLYLSIGPGGIPASDFKIDALTAARDDNDVPLVQATIRNTGGRALDLTGSLRLSDGPGGLSAGPFPITLGTTLGIGQSEPVSVTLDKRLPDGPWLATLRVQSGLVERTAEATLTFPSGPGVGDTVAIDPAAGIPWWTIAAGLATGCLLLALALAVRRRGRANRASRGKRRDRGKNLAPLDT